MAESHQSSIAFSSPSPHHPPCIPRKFKGARMRKWGKWVSEIRLPHSRKRVWLGSFPTQEDAARAFDFAALFLRGKSSISSLNFKDSPHQFLGACSGAYPLFVQRIARAVSREAARTSKASTSSCAKERDDSGSSFEESMEDEDKGANECLEVQEELWIPDLITFDEIPGLSVADFSKGVDNYPEPTTYFGGTDFVIGSNIYS